jgi:PIN domain nuclease of toxin-antitoxin system
VSDGPAAIDASALLALIFGEKLNVDQRAFVGGILSTVNLAEALTKMVDIGATAEDALADIEALGLDLTLVEFDRDAAVETAGLRAQTKRLGLSLGDRGCLSAARSRGIPALTADRAWTKLEGVEVVLVR